MYRLVQIAGAETGRAVELRGQHFFGRATSNEVMIADPAVSREQMALTVQNGATYLHVRDGAAPVFVNGVSVRQTVLLAGDVLRVGGSEFRLEAPALASPDDRTVMGLAPAPTASLSPGYPPEPLAVPSSAPMGYPNAGPTVVMAPNQVTNVQVVQRSDNTALWVLLAVVFACPLMCVGLVALAFLPYVMTVVGLVMFVIGYREWSSWRGRYAIPSSTYVKMWGGALIGGLGLIWSVAAIISQYSGPR